MFFQKIMFLQRLYEKAINRAYKRSFNIESKLDKLEANVSKMYDINRSYIDKLVNKVSSWYISRMNELTKNNNNDILDYATLSKLVILDNLNFNGLLQDFSDNKIEARFKDDFSFRREILFATQYKVLSVLGKSKGSEYALVFEKAFNFSYDPSIRYASYDTGIYGEEYMRFLDIYLKIGGSTGVYILKDYYSKDPIRRYNMEELTTIIDEIRQYKNMQKQKKIGF